MEKRERAQMVVAMFALGVMAGGGCADARRGAGALHDAGPLVFPTAGVLAYERDPTIPARHEWFEFGRNDAGLGARRAAPLLATSEWPLPLRPAERRIRFHYWEQR